MSEEYLQKLIISNLKKILNHHGFNSVEEFAEEVEINTTTVESWFSFRRCPKIKSLDRISDRLNIPTYILFQEDLQLSDFVNTQGIKNDSSKALDNNLKKAYRNLNKNSWDEISSIYRGLLSINTLKSYHRENGSIMPPIATLEKLSSYLGIPASELIKESKSEEDQ